MKTGIGDYLKLQLDWSDTTPYGALLSGRIQRTIQQDLHPQTFTQVKNWMEGSTEIDNRALTKTVRAERHAAHYQQLLTNPAFLHPPTEKTLPHKLYLRDLNNTVHAVIPLNATNPQQYVAALRAETADIPLPLAAVIHKTKQQLKTYTRPHLASEPLVMVGHACVSLFHHGIRLWLDPFFLPKRTQYKTWQPLSILDLPAEQHCVLFTHSHPDHFDPASLLLFPANTLFIVPPCPDGESIVSLDMAFRLRQLGFENIQTLAWWNNLTLGEFTLTALPFYGEQAVGFSGETPLLWNHGSTWHIRRKYDAKTFLFLADSGSDPRQYTTHFARQIRKTLGKVNYLFGNCRRWRLYPTQYITSSVPQYLVITPDNELAIPQTIMLEAHELAAFAEICHADYVLPYAMGGTPWFSELGLGYAHENHAATDFDADPRETLQGSRTSLRLPPAFQQIDALAGSYLNAEDKLQAPFEYPFILQQPNTVIQDYVLTLISPSIQPNSLITQELAQLATLSEQAVVTLSHNFCEFWLPQTDTFTQHILSSWLEHYTDSYIIGNDPQSITGFAQQITWRSLAKQLLQSAHYSLLHEDNENTLTQALKTAPFNIVSNALLQIVYQGLTSVTIDLKCTSETKPYKINHLPKIELPLPLQQAALMEKYTPNETALALLIAKCLHNSWLTRYIMGKTAQSEKEFIKNLWIQAF